MRILLCDDHVLLAEALESLLSAAGHQVSVVSSSEQALRALEEQQPDVCVLDIGLPDGDGIEVLAHASECSPSTQVLMLSASRDPELVRAAIDLGARGYLCKDVGVIEVIRAVERVRDGEVVLDPLVVKALAQRPRAQLDDIDWLLGLPDAAGARGAPAHRARPGHARDGDGHARQQEHRAHARAERPAQARGPLPAGGRRGSLAAPA